MNQDQRLMLLRKFLSAPLTDGLVKRLRNMLAHWPEEEGKEVAIAYTEAHLQGLGYSLEENEQEHDEYELPQHEGIRTKVNTARCYGAIPRYILRK